MMIQMRDRADRPVSPPDAENPLTCEDFQGQMPELMGSGIHQHEHWKTCERCTALLEELEYIARIAGDLMLPVYEPGDGVWKRITDSLQQDVKPAEHAKNHAADPTRTG